MEIARWFAVSSLQVTGKAQHRKSAQQADALHLILVRSGGKEALRNLRNSHGFELSIADDGPGFPAALNPTISPTLGLRLVRDLTHQIRRKVTLASSATGTRIVVRWPVQGGTSEPETPLVPTPINTQKNMSQLRILIVEDEAITAAAAAAAEAENEGCGCLINLAFAIGLGFWIYSLFAKGC